MTQRQTTQNRCVRAMLSAQLLFMVSACDPKSQPGTAEPPRLVSNSGPAVEPGAEAATAHFAMSVKGSRPCTVAPHLAPPQGFSKFSVEVEIRGLSESEVPANPFYATLTTAEGREFESTLDGCQPLLPAERLTRPRTVRGWITFDVPEASRPKTLIYRPIILGAGSQKVELLLGP